MNKNKVFITINHLDDIGGGPSAMNVNDQITLQKDLMNPYDDEAILVYGKHGEKCGYVANSVCTVARGTRSVGRIYDKIEEDQKAVILFITDELLIAELL